MAEELDWLAAGERLKELLLPLKAKGLRDVFVATDQADVKNLAQFVPSVHILYQGDHVGDGSQSGLTKTATQSWLLLLVHRATPGQPSAGVWLGRILQAVSGQACGNHTFVRASAGVRPSYAGGVAYLPLQFDITVKFKGDRP